MSRFSILSKQTVLLFIIIFNSVISFAEEYEVTSGDSVTTILQNKKYGNTYTELIPYIEKIKLLNSKYFSNHGIDLILPGTLLQLPEHPDTPESSDVVVTPIIETPAKEAPAVKIIGNMIVETGTAYIIRDGNRLTAKRINGLQSGDTINTANNTKVNIALIDDSKYELGSNSDFKINEYNYYAEGISDTEKQINTSIITLIKGVARTLTGKIGKLSIDKYKFRTRTVTIGIRGTEFTSRFCEGDQCGNFPGASVAVTNGIIDATNKSGTVSLKENEFINVSNADKKIEITAIPVGFLDLEKDITDLEMPWWQKLMLKIKGIIENR